MQVDAMVDYKVMLVRLSDGAHRLGRRNSVLPHDGSHPSKLINICRSFDIPRKIKALAW
jgi:hypothetical protein